MTKAINQSKKGFTIIEVVLVLAIAGLIFLMVFVALPTLQRSQRDTQRRQDMARLATALTNWQANNNNKLPQNATDAAALMNNYLKKGGDTFADPSDGDYTISISDSAAVAGTRPQIVIRTGARCEGESISTDNAGPNSFAILYSLEGAGTSCTDNQ